MKQFLLGSLCTVVVAVLGGLIYLRLGLADVRGDARASRLESSLMQMAVHASVRRQAPNITNPVAPSEDNLIAGGKIYLNECSGCHGTPGKPNEPDSLNPAAPRLAETGTGYSEAQIFWVAKHGIRRSGMFSNGVWDSDQKLWTVAAYICRVRNLPQRVAQEIATAAAKPGS
jgi:mono/diheme cytochrome c family protein